MMSSIDNNISITNQIASLNDFQKVILSCFVMKLVAILLYLKCGCVCECDHMHMTSVNMQDVVLCCVVSGKTECHN